MNTANMKHDNNSLKTLMTATTITGMLMMATPTFASTLSNDTANYDVSSIDANYQPSKKVQAQQGATVVSSILVGTAVGGPAGAFAGFIASYFLVDKITEADKGQLARVQLAASTERAEKLQSELLALEEREQEQMTLASLQLQLLFHTGKDTLNPRGQEKINTLAQHLLANPHLNIRLDGYADPRGTDEYNNVLSNYRAANVAESLMQAGVSAERISQYYHGSSQSTAATGSAEDYAFERRVAVQVFNSNSPEGQQADVAAASISHNP